MGPGKPPELESAFWLVLSVLPLPAAPVLVCGVGSLRWSVGAARLRWRERLGGKRRFIGDCQGVDECRRDVTPIDAVFQAPFKLGDGSIVVERRAEHRFAKGDIVPPGMGSIGHDLHGEGIFSKTPGMRDRRSPNWIQPRRGY